MNPYLARAGHITRRQFLKNCQLGLGGLALGELLGAETTHASEEGNGPAGTADRRPNHSPRAKNVIYVHLAGGPPQHELFDYKPKLNELNSQPCPDDLVNGQTFAFIKGHPSLLGSPYKFARHGRSGVWVSELLPNISEIVDDIAIVKSMRTDQFNHGPAQLLLYTGSPRFGGASIGAWITYGLGSASRDLPSFVVLTTGGSDPSGGNGLWGSGYLPTIYQGVQCRVGTDPIFYVSDPPGLDRAARRRSLDALRELNDLEFQQFGDPETLTRIHQYELAYRMQIAVPEVMDISEEPASVRELYGADPGATSFANNCLLARRLVERGVRYVQLFDWGWDVHGSAMSDDLLHQLPEKCKQTDRPVAALIKDLKQRGLLDETLVIWGGEFGRTSMNEARGGSKFLGRDHHPHCFTMWMAGGGIQGGVEYGETDELGYFVVRDPVNVKDLHATILHLLGLNPYELQFSYQGLGERLIGPTDEAEVRHELLA